MAQCLARTDGQGNRIEHEINYFHCDQIGVPREMTDSEGKLIWRGRYDAWGGLHYDRHLTQQNQGHQPFRLQNQYFDEETGLHYNFLRYYEPMTGRFMTQDPIGLAGGENFYRFEGAVQNQIDPIGLFALALAPWLMEGLAYVGTAVAGILIAAGIMDAKEEHDKAQVSGKCDSPKPKCPDDVYKKLTDKVEEAKKRGANLGGCREEMNNFDLQARIDASIEEAKARKIRENTCWEGGDNGHKEQINNIHKRIDNCRKYIRINNRKGLL
ncbi:RHS repeat-associated core domain-containing protein [Rodentibacter caecimuris]|uniref:RHS repeat-associated core domain-containing protein n=1 Tax=Rodentibacter caecimuris TaxID=1796644 RepID=UPI0021504B65|nr:RHS repeat-associated core domain-containing protein [Pasteurella caecimuris]MCR1837822.1 RHS domain-containing protein [Pasteurella caecimuris]MCU0108120.1 RHS domain-containing protein [Pasteurella caecimuris]